MVATNKAVYNNKKKYRKIVHLLIKTRLPIMWIIDIIRQTLKSKQGKQVFLTLYHINCPSKRLRE